MIGLLAGVVAGSTVIPIELEIAVQIDAKEVWIGTAVGIVPVLTP